MTTIETPTTSSPAAGDTSTSEAEDGAARMIGIINDGAICVLTSIGHELGIFDTMADLPPATSQQIADAAGLNERYVREWLGGVVTAGFVDYLPGEGHYSLCPGHAPLLVSGGPDCVSVLARYLTLSGQVQPKLVEKFRSGGGLSYDDYPGFNELQASETAAVFDASLVDLMLPVTGEVDRLRTGITVVDVGCGQGHAVNLMARAFPASSFTGLDLAPEAVAAARAEAAAWGLRNATFEVCDIAGPVTEPSTYDLVTAFDTIHDQAHPATVLANIRAALKPDGTFLMVDFNTSSNLEENTDLPWASLVYMISTVHCMSVSLAQDGDGLGTAWGRQTAVRMLGEAGFGDVMVHELEADPFNAYFVAR